MLWREVMRQASQVAATATTVLVTGESGTGKEVVARFIHRESPRCRGPFVGLNCAALPLQEREFSRLGGTRTLKADIRVIAATNRSLTAAVDTGALREDLFFGRAPAQLSADAFHALLRHSWRGNARELRNVLERAVILNDSGSIRVEDLRLASRLRTPAPVTVNVETNLSIVEREMIFRVLLESRWNKSVAATRLGLTRMQLYSRIRKHQLDSAQAALSALEDATRASDGTLTRRSGALPRAPGSRRL